MNTIVFCDANGTEVIFVLRPGSLLKNLTNGTKEDFLFYPDSSDYQTYYRLNSKWYQDVRKQMLKGLQ